MELVFILFEDSPKNLIINKNFEEAQELINKITNKNFFLYEIKSIQINIRNNFNLDETFKLNIGIKKIFEKKIFSYTILLIFANFLIYFSYFGITSIYPSVLKKIYDENLNYEHEEIKNNFCINILMKYNFIGIIIILLAAFFSEWNLFNKKNSQIFVLGFSIFFIIMSFLFTEIFYLFLSLSYHLTYLSFYMWTSYTEEFYPIHIRIKALKLISLTNGIAGCLSQFVFIYIFYIDKFYPLFSFAVTFIIFACVVLYLPDDNGKKIDDLIFEDYFNKDIIEIDKNILIN